ncbi:ABC transporter B family member 14, partial [Bienertia sinuspersici]
VGSLTSKLEADATLVRTGLVDCLSTIVQNTILIAATFVVAFKLNWRIAAVTVAMFSLLIGSSIAMYEISDCQFPAFIIQKLQLYMVKITYINKEKDASKQRFLKGFGGDYTGAYYRANALARKAISNIRTVNAFGFEEQISKQFATHLNQPNKQALLCGHFIRAQPWVCVCSAEAWAE